MTKLFNMNKQAQQPVQAAAEVDTMALMSQAQTEGVATAAPTESPNKGGKAKKIAGVVLGALALGTGIFLLGRKSGKNSAPVYTGDNSDNNEEEDVIDDDVFEDSET